MLRIAAMLLVLLPAACADTGNPPVSSGSNALSGTRFTGNYTSNDNRCFVPGCNAAIELWFDDRGTVSIRYLEDARVTPGELLLARGTRHQGFHAVSIRGNEVRFTKERHEYTLVYSDNCLTGRMRHKVNNLIFDVKACETP